MKKIVAILVLTVAISACKKELQDPDKQVQVQPEIQSKKQPPPPTANPVFAYQDYKKISNQLTVSAIYVMDVTGANPTAVYANYSGQGNNTVVNYPDYPAWSPDGSKLCFTLNSKDLYTLNVSLANGVPTGSNAIKIADGVAGGGSYKQGKWRPGTNQIACVWKKTGDPDKIHLLSSSGGSPTVLYATANTDWLIEDDIAFKADGSNLVFSERQISTGFVFLKVLDVSTSQVIKTIDLSQYKSIKEMDWARSSNSNIAAITTVPRCDTTIIGLNGIHQLQTVDVSAATPALTLVQNDVGNISFAPNDQQITVNSGGLRVGGGSGCAFSQYDGILIYTIAAHTLTFPSYTGGNHHDWKR